MAERAVEKGAGPRPRVVAVVPAAGSGLRMGADRPKQYLELGGRPILVHTLEVLERCPEVDALVVVVPPHDVEPCKKDLVESRGLAKAVTVAAGGPRRQDSVRLGLEASGDAFDYALIHDGVRPLVDPETVARVLRTAWVHGAAVAGLPAKDTVKEVDGQGRVVRTPDRGRLWLVQTPQAFRFQEILEAHRRAFQEQWPEATDDAAVAERAGLGVRVVLGTERNIKVTTPHDLALAEFYLRHEGK